MVRHEQPPSAPTPLADSVREAAAARPKSLAVADPDHPVTYRELIEAADRVADGLRVSGAGTIAVTGPKGAGFVVAILAAQIAAVRVVTVDPALPAARRAFMVECAGADFALATDEASAAEASGLLPVSRISPDGRAILDALPHCPLAIGGRDGCVFFASGATGTPKTAVSSQQEISAFVRWQRDRFAVGRKDRFALVNTASAAAILCDVFTPLSAGATLCVPPSDLDVRAGDVGTWLDAEGITVVHTSPGLANRWLAATAGNAGRQPRRLRASFFAGAPLHDSMVSRWRERFPETRVINLYRPAGIVLPRFCHEVGSPVPGIQPVGSPLPETRFRLVDGELWLWHPDQPDYPGSARGFLPDPETGELWYQTGEFGHLDDDGLLHMSAPPVRDKPVPTPGGEAKSVSKSSAGNPATLASFLGG